MKTTKRSAQLLSSLLLSPLLLSLIQSGPALAQGNSVFTKSGAQSPGKGMKIKLSKVPQFDLTSAKSIKVKQGPKTVSIKAIPDLEVGLEPVLTTNSTAQIVPPLLDKKPLINSLNVLKPFQYPKGTKAPSKALTNLQPSTKITEPNEKNTVLPNYPVVPPTEVKEAIAKEKEIKVFSQDDIKFIQALIFSDVHGNHELAMGLFADLLGSSEYANLAKLNLGISAKKLGLQNEFEQRMLNVIEKDPKLARTALEQLTQYIKPTNLPLAEKVEPYVEKYDLSTDLTGPWSIARAKGLMEDKKIEKALAIIEEIPDANPYRHEGNYLKALILYRGNHIDEAQEILEKEITFLEKQNYIWDIKSLVAMTLARTYFQRGQYEKAFKTYLKVEKNHPLWLQSLIETAWTQILSKDFEGAAGNMFSLHTDYFKNAYQPESYLVRTVGYLNLCQYGDALAVIKQFAKKYTYVRTRVQDYQKSKKNDLDYYETVKSFLKAPEQREVDNLPRSLIVEMARSPLFLQKQRQINEIEDEAQKYIQVSKALLDQEKKIAEMIQKSKDKVADTEARLAKNKDSTKKPGLESDLRYHQGRVIAFETQFAVAKKGRQSVKELREKALVNLETTEKAQRLEGAKILKSELVKVEKDISHLIEQADLLQYEIYSGAGEQIRYQMAGGEATNEKGAELKPDDAGAQKWGFKGEIWEDEVGHFRSSLKSICPKEENKL